MILHPFFALVALFWLAAPVAVAVLIVWAVARRPSASTSPTPHDILARRFASGEISADEYQKALDLLRGSNPPAG